MPLSAPAKHPRCFHDLKAFSTWPAFYSQVVLRCCGLAHHLHLSGLTRLVPRLIYTIARGFEGRVILTSTTGSSRHNIVTYGLISTSRPLYLLLGVWDGVDRDSIGELRCPIELLSTDTILPQL